MELHKNNAPRKDQIININLANWTLVLLSAVLITDNASADWYNGSYVTPSEPASRCMNCDDGTTSNNNDYNYDNGAAARAEERAATRARNAVIDSYNGKIEESEELRKALEGARWPAILGGEKFKDWIKAEYLGGKLDNRDLPEGRALLREKKISEIKEWAVREWGIEKDDWHKIIRGQEQPQRRAMIYVSRWNLKAGSKEISLEFGGIGHSAISKQCRLAESEILQKRGCWKYVCQLRKHLKCQVKT